MDFSIILPVYNEAGIIDNNLKNIFAYLDKKDFSWELIIVNDGSTDQTGEIINKFNRLRIIENKTNCGKGWSVRKGMLAAEGEKCLFLDADLSTDISELDRFLPFIDENDIIIGTRQSLDTEILKSQPIYRVMLGRLGNFLIRVILNFKFKDTQCGFKLFDKKTRVIFEKQTIKRWGFDFELIILAQKMKFKIKEIGVRWQDGESSKIKPISYLNTLIELLKIKINLLTKKYG